MSNPIVSDVRSQLIELKHRLVATMADEQRLYQRHTEASRVEDRWKRRAEMAVSKGSDELARGALARANKLEADAAEFHRQYMEQKGFVEQMKVRLLELETLARSRPTTLPPPPDVERLERSLAGLERWEDRAREERARLAAWAELERDEVAEKLAALEREDQLERQLAELKARVRGA